MTDAKSTPRRGNRFERLSRGRQIAVVGGICLVLIVALFAAAEAAVRLRVWLKYGQSVVRIEDTYYYNEEAGLRLPKPGLTTHRLTINSLGFRSPEIPAVKPADTFRLAFLGGSTTYSAEVSGDDKTWPHLVVDDLTEAHPDRTFDYLNAGVPGFTTVESLKRFEAQVEELDPDLVVIYHASNDLSGNSREAARAQGLNAASQSRNLSWLSQWSKLAYLVEKNLRVIALQEATEDSENKLEVNTEALAEPFETRLRTLVRTVKDSGADVALVTFVTRVRADQSPDEQKASVESALYYMPYMTPAGLIESFDAYNQVVRKVAEAEGAILIDAAGAVPGDEALFADSVHFSDEGSAAMAAAVAEQLRAAAPFQ